jgi:hypothetical protein
MRLRTLAYLAVAFWLGRWLAMELASFAGHRLLRPGPPPTESTRRPGWMPLRGD